MGAFPQLLAAYEHKERFYHIWDCASRRDAEQALAAWIDDIPVTNAFTESINRLAKDKNRDGRGYSFEVMRARMLWGQFTKRKKLYAKPLASMISTPFFPQFIKLRSN